MNSLHKAETHIGDSQSMPNAQRVYERGRLWPNLGRRAANMLALASFALLILVGVLAAALAA